MRAGLERWQIQRQQRGENVVMRGGVSARRHVRHHQLLHPLRKMQRQLHRRLAAHRMADDPRTLQSARGEKPVHIGGHHRIIHFRAVRRLAVIAMIQREDVKGLRQPHRDGVPIVGRPKQTVQQDHRRALSALLEMKLHE